METEKTFEFVYDFRSNGSSRRLKLPLKLPYVGNARELAVRVIQAHKLPQYLEDDLYDQLLRFVKGSSQELMDKEAEERMVEGSVFEKGSDVDTTIDKWAGQFAENHVQFSSPTSVTSGSGVSAVDVSVGRGGEGGDRDLTFSEVYHKLIHSPALDTLLQLEHTYAMAVADVCKGRENASDILQKRHDAELSEVMQALGTTRTERDINNLMRRHMLERETCELRWSNELNQLQETQRREYREWVTKVNEDMMTGSENMPYSPSIRPPPDPDAEPISPPPLHLTEDNEPPLQESFTIHLGTQKKTMHNVRLLCGDPLDLCHHRKQVGPMPNPERLQTAMSLYSTKLSAMVMLVDGRVNSLVGMKEAFAKVCRQSTDFHFPDVDVQLTRVAECALIGNQERKEQQLVTSMSSVTSDSQISRSSSPMDTNKSLNASGSSEVFSSLSPPTGSQATPTTPTSDAQHLLTPESNAGVDGENVKWNIGHNNGSSQRSSQNGNGTQGTSGLQETTSVSLQPGDFYLTRHSNLSQVHVVFHLVTDEVGVQSSSLRSRHPVVAGLKNCLRVAARHDVHHITIPLLLVHRMQPEMTINWCLKRAELIFKSVKGFMLEDPCWGVGDSRTIQFLIPKEISEDMFEEVCDMLPKVFRIATSKKFTSRVRTASYK